MKRAALAFLLAALAACTSAPGPTELNTAVAGGDLARVRSLLAAGAGIEAPDGDGATPLLVALLNEKKDILDVLLEQGADANATNVIASRLFAKFVPAPREARVHMTPLIIAAMVGDEAMVRALLDHGAAVDKPGEDSFTALQAAAVANRPAVAKLLVERGASLEATNTVGQTAVDMAQFLGNTAVVEVLEAASLGITIHPIDVAGHYTIAVRTDMQPLGGVWHWSTMPVGVAVGADGSVFWTQYRTNSVHRAEADGTRAEQIASGIDGPLGLAIDRRIGRLFFTTDRHFPRSVQSLDPGGQPKTLVQGTRVDRPFAIAVDEAGDAIYWTESINGSVRRAALDGTKLTTLFDDGIGGESERPDTIATSLAAIAIDSQDGFVYFADIRRGEIMRARLGHSDRQTILGHAQGVDVPTGLAVDVAGRKIYWANPGAESISRADLDGSDVEVVADAADGVLEPWGLAVDPERRLLYWTDAARDGIWRTSLDRKHIEKFADLADPEPPVVENGGCEALTAVAEREFLRRWVKLVRTCLVKVAANKAVMRYASDIRVPAATCVRQLGRARDVEPLRARLAPHCDAAQIGAAIEATARLGAEIIDADLPRAAEWLSDVRPFVAAEGSDDARLALATIDDLLERLGELHPAPIADEKWTLPASGQTTTYAASTRKAGGPIDARVPDDGAIRAGAPLAYVDNGDGTVTDSTTGLTWEKKCDGCKGLHDAATTYAWQKSFGSMNVAGWLDAVNAEGEGGFAGHSDWRLPELAELLMIGDFERFNPMVSTAFQNSGCGLQCADVRAPECSCTGLSTYWTATVRSRKPPGSVAVVGFHLGFAWELPADAGAMVRAVRGPAPEHDRRFTDNGDGTITDRRTRLMWEKKCRRPGDLHDSERRPYWSFDGREETIWDWLASVNTEEGRGFAGHDDWRIPNIKEMATLLAPTPNVPHIDPIFTTENCEDVRDPECSTTAAEFHWTSTSFADFPLQALAVGFGAVIVDGRLKTVPLAVRAVRGPVAAPG